MDDTGFLVEARQQVDLDTLAPPQPSANHFIDALRKAYMETSQELLLRSSDYEQKVAQDLKQISENLHKPAILTDIENALEIFRYNVGMRFKTPLVKMTPHGNFMFGDFGISSMQRPTRYAAIDPGYGPGMGRSALGNLPRDQRKDSEILEQVFEKLPSVYRTGLVPGP